MKRRMNDAQRARWAEFQPGGYNGDDAELPAWAYAGLIALGLMLVLGMVF